MITHTSLPQSLPQSLLDTDLYKFTMMQVVWSRFPQTDVEYAFKCRSTGVDLRPFAAEIQQGIEALCVLRFTEEEIAYLRGIRFLKSAFVDTLRGFALDPTTVQITTEGEFVLRIRGSWLQTILWEVPLLALINEVYFAHTHPDAPERCPEGRARLLAKCARIQAADTPLRIMEFGTRRRYSRLWQREVMQTLLEQCPTNILGTSNVALARDFSAFGVKPLGTMAHEFLQAGQAFAPVPDSQKFALEAWMQEYRGDLGIALSDIFGMDAFLNDFDLLFSKAFDGARHDSGDPFVWGEKLIAHYERYQIDPRTKTAVFSDGLDIEKAIALSRQFDSRIRTIFGIGTHLTNDFDFAALQIVIKMVRCNGRPVVKLSDSPGKTMSEDPAYLAYIRSVFGL
jgi:nicotinate phosphoribosyltransferase